MSSVIVTRPEIDIQAAIDFDRDCVKSTEASAVKTSIDILEVVCGGEITRFMENLGHAQITDYLEHVQNQEPASRPLLTIFFLKTPNPATLIKLQHTYDISPTFLYRAAYKFHSTFKSYLLTTSSGIAGTYCISPAIDGHHPMVQFKHDISNKSSVYFIAHASTEVVCQIKATAFPRILTPFLIDLFIFDYALDKEIDAAFTGVKIETLKIERANKELPAIDDSNIRHMHNLAQMIATGTLDCEDFLVNQMSFLISSNNFLREINGISEEQFTYVSGVLQAQERRAKTIHNWYQGYQKRLDVQINLAFNLKFQRDSETNVKIAKDTAKIAQDAQRDSASMITIAAVTMFFLPGTFVCAVFSTVFFHMEVDAETGNSTFSVSPKLWYFFAFTAPLTVAIFAVWICWSRQPRRSKEATLEDVENQFSGKHNTQGGRMNGQVSVNNDVALVGPRIAGPSSKKVFASQISYDVKFDRVRVIDEIAGQN